MFRYIRRQYWNIERVIRWIPVIWNDREFDHTYLLELISFKLGRMEKFYRSKYAMCVDSEKNAEEIHVCKALCDRLIADDYHDMLGRKVKLHWGAIGKSGYGTAHFETLDKGCQLGICKDWIHYEDRMYAQDLELFCKILQKHLRGWWD